MDSGRRVRRSGSIRIVAAAFAALILLPAFLIGVAMFEGHAFGTQHVVRTYKTIGIFEPLDWLVEKVVDFFH